MVTCGLYTIYLIQFRSLYMSVFSIQNTPRTTLWSTHSWRLSKLLQTREPHVQMFLRATCLDVTNCDEALEFFSWEDIFKKMPPGAFTEEVATYIQHSQESGSGGAGTLPARPAPSRYVYLFTVVNIVELCQPLPSIIASCAAYFLCAFPHYILLNNYFLEFNNFYLITLCRNYCQLSFFVMRGQTPQSLEQLDLKKSIANTYAVRFQVMISSK